VYHIHPEVKRALEEQRAVVALESTIIAHGMPYPQNVETALMCEQIIRAHHAIPATIAILGGKIHVGMSPQEIETIGQKGKAVYKTSRRDLPFVLAGGHDGALTVAGTMFVAAECGIKVFATGGIGGVHRQAEHTFDISQDLDELSRSDVVVVSAGAKSILDLAKTLEYLETKSVPVIGYRTDVFPEFFTRESALRIPYRYDSVQAIADFILKRAQLHIHGGVLIANPIPESYSLAKSIIDATITEALLQAEAEHIHGKEVTPFLLQKINELTDGKSLEANRQLVYNNCELAAKIAVCIHRSEAKG
jgi:pseudouridine-5'-phosphate glycosidase